MAWGDCVNINEEIAAFLAHCEEKGLSGTTVRCYGIDLRMFSCYVQNKYSEKKLVQFFEELKSVSAATARRRYSSLKAFFDFMVESGVFIANPIVKLNLYVAAPHNEAEAPIDVAIIDRILRKAYQSKEDCLSEYYYKLAIRDIAIIEFIANTGAMQVEVINLTADDVDVTSGMIVFHGKGNRERVIKIENEQTLVALREYYAEFKGEINSSGYFFVTRLKKKMSEHVIRQIFKKYAEECGVTPKQFRQTFAFLLYDNGMDVNYIQRIMGHSEMAVTKRYTERSEKSPSVISVSGYKGKGK